MQIDLDFEVFQLLTLRRKSEDDSISDVIRRLLMLAESESFEGNVQDGLTPASKPTLKTMFLANESTKNGAWIGNVFFPNGTRFRATYKGQTFRAEIRDEVWVDGSGKTRKSPSEAASAISGTSVNGWRFWYGLRPGEEDWQRLDEFRK